MAAYAGTINVIFSISLGSRRVNLLQCNITSYPGSGIPFYPQIAGLGVIEAVFNTINGSMSDSNSPDCTAYDSVHNLLYLYANPGTPITDGTNIYSECGSLMLLVIGA